MGRCAAGVGRFPVSAKGEAGDIHSVLVLPRRCSTPDRMEGDASAVGRLVGTVAGVGGGCLVCGGALDRSTDLEMASSLLMGCGTVVCGVAGTG